MTTLPRCNPQRSEDSFRQSLRSVRWGFFALSIHCPTRNWMICRLTLPRIQRPTVHLWKYGKDRTEGAEGSHENSHAPFSLLLILHRSTTELSLDLVRLQFITSVSLDRGIKSSGKNGILSFDVVVLTSRRVLPNSATSISIVYL